MTRYMTGVLTIIAVGVMLIAYGLLTRPASAADSYFYDPARAGQYGVPPQYAYPDASFAGASDYVLVPRSALMGAQGAMLPAGYAPVAANPYAVPAVMQAPAAPAPRRTTTAQRAGPKRNWGKTALVIGGSSAAGAGIGGLIGGKKGALIGAAIGGGASTIYESTK